MTRVTLSDIITTRFLNKVNFELKLIGLALKKSR